jgi:hypothetical protein
VVCRPLDSKTREERGVASGGGHWHGAQRRPRRRSRSTSRISAIAVRRVRRQLDADRALGLIAPGSGATLDREAARSVERLWATSRIKVCLPILAARQARETLQASAATGWVRHLVSPLSVAALHPRPVREAWRAPWRIALLSGTVRNLRFAAFSAGRLGMRLAAQRQGRLTRRCPPQEL